ncbi:hypothetical protein E4665_16560 [Sporolactobacillus shoreae]|uniref:Uncharacterized protein n=1 Tax=Sporolactobacillus shoreae TaxID=1465501 RepID=A0A4Z0GHB0_9BACL|nr:hypothetical protein [Sporolactobacillus shoreae]TGA96120.1 hypothetical protein E4665_16560 [Sporolactobacillus shoreae]
MSRISDLVHLPFDLKMKLMENKIERGIGQGLIDTVKDTALGIIETVQHPIQTSVGIYDALSNWNLTSALLAQSISDSFERNMVHGDAYTRSRWITYAVATIVTSVIGTKGIDKVGKATDVAKLGSMASGTATKVGKVAGEWTQVKVNQAASRVSGNMSYFEMPRLEN